ncbi:MAG: hypothetical protein F6K55_30755 [Moorea sp. SIO4A3]|nr:hypothetical protein [Moorena sp. SIO4A3]
MGYSSLFPVPCSLFPKTRNSVPHTYDNCYISTSITQNADAWVTNA